MAVVALGLALRGVGSVARMIVVGMIQLTDAVGGTGRLRLLAGTRGTSLIRQSVQLHQRLVVGAGLTGVAQTLLLERSGGRHREAQTIILIGAGLRESGRGVPINAADHPHHAGHHPVMSWISAHGLPCMTWTDRR